MLTETPAFIYVNEVSDLVTTGPPLYVLPSREWDQRKY